MCVFFSVFFYFILLYVLLHVYSLLFSILKTEAFPPLKKKKEKRKHLEGSCFAVNELWLLLLLASA